jgi:hemolysin activation/secretion protein
MGLGAPVGAAVRFSLVAATVVSTVPAFAQTAPRDGLPARPQVELPTPQTEKAPPSSVRVDGSRGVPTAPCPLDRFDLQVKITAIDFVTPDGKSIPSEIAELLAPIAASPPAGETKVAVVCQIRDRATAALRREGYVASVQIPPQRIENGVLKLEVVTAHIVEVRVRGEVGPYRKTLAARIEKLKAIDPLNEHAAERILLLADDVPGLDVQLALRPAGTGAGAVIGDLTISYRPGAIMANVQNLGSRQLGRYTGYARAEIYGLTGASDLTYIGGQVTSQIKEQKVVQAGHVMGLGNNGTTLSVSGTYAWSRPDLGDLDLRARSAIGSITLQTPLRRSVTKNLIAAGGLDIVGQRTRVYGDNTPSSPLNRDRIRTLFLRLSGSQRKPLPNGTDLYFIGGRVEVRKGIDVLGATAPQSVSASGYTPSRFEGKSTATVVQGDLDAMVALGPIFSVAGSARGQWASDPLLNYDEFSIGNLTLGRGYDPGANSGDRVVGLRGEARADVIATPRFHAQVFGFYDSLWIWNLDTNAIENDRNLSSYGGGVRLTLPGKLLLEAMYARPRNPALLLPGAKRATDRVLVSITTRFGLGGR